MDEMLLRSWDKTVIKARHEGAKSNRLTKEENPNYWVEKKKYSGKFISSI